MKNFVFVNFFFKSTKNICRIVCMRGKFHSRNVTNLETSVSKSSRSVTFDHLVLNSFGTRNM